MAERRRGIVYLVGAGPGDPGLLTRRGAELLQGAQAVVYDSLVSEMVLALIAPQAERYDAGKRASRHTLAQEEIHALLARLAGEGKTVVRLKGGDPFLFGRGGEEGEFLRARGIPFEVVPGVSSAIAAPAYAGIPVTHRRYNSELCLITGHEDPNKEGRPIDWPALARGHKAIAMLMGMAHLGKNLARLLAEGLPPATPAALIQWGTTPRQRTCLATAATLLEEARRQGIAAPAVCVIGEVVALRRHLSWFEQRPLFGRSVLVTRDAAQAPEMAEKLLRLGAQPLLLPVIEIVPRPADDAWSTFAQQFARRGWLILTSANAVRLFFERLYAQGRDARQLSGLSVMAIGPATAQALARHGIAADRVAEEFCAEGILAALATDEIAGQNFFLPRAAAASEVLPQKLRAAGGHVFEYALYHTAVPAGARERLDEILRQEQIDWICCTASSTVRHFLELLGDRPLPEGAKFASIGPVTTRALLRCGRKPAVEGRAYTVDGLLAAMAEFEVKAKTR